jgi:hypothetical protein
MNINKDLKKFICNLKSSSMIAIYDKKTQINAWLHSLM